jgi:hypothetical protein
VLALANNRPVVRDEDLGAVGSDAGPGELAGGPEAAAPVLDTKKRAIDRVDCAFLPLPPARRLSAFRDVLRLAAG